MLHLDTNVLVALPEWVRQGSSLISRVVDGEPAAACSVVWYEYVVGPLQDGEARLARAFLQGGIVAVSEEDAVLAARLYNEAGRKRRFKTDALIAATAIHAGADFLTANAADFRPFVDFGLQLKAIHI